MGERTDQEDVDAHALANDIGQEDASDDVPMPRKVGPTCDLRWGSMRAKVSERHVIALLALFVMAIGPVLLTKVTTVTISVGGTVSGWSFATSTAMFAAVLAVVGLSFRYVSKR